jgi:hypothetical protein
MIITEKLNKISNKLNLPYYTPEFLKIGHFPSLNGWRAVAILMVILEHVKYSIPPDTFFRNNTFNIWINRH